MSLEHGRHHVRAKSNFLEGYQLESDWCAEVDVSLRTSQRYRLNEVPGLPYVELGGKIYINIEGGRQWLANRTRRRNVEEAA